MRGVVLVLACASCDGVFGLNQVPLPVDAAAPSDVSNPGDGSSSTADAPAGELTIMLPSSPSVWVDDTLTLTATINGPIHAVVTTSASATAGTVTNVPTNVLLNGNGLGSFPVTYTAPSSTGPVEVTFDAATGSLSTEQTLPLVVLPLASIGIDAQQAQHQPISANDAIGEKVTLMSTVTVRKIGLWTASTGTHVRLGIYDVNGSGTPGQLKTQAAPFALVNGRNETDVTPVTLTAGDYWIVADFDASTELQYFIGSSGLYGTSNYSYASTFPLVWGATWVDVGGSTMALFMRVEQ